jgi:hypothetical protein
MAKKKVYRSGRAGTYVVKAAESRSARVTSKKGKATSKQSSGKLARAVLKDWQSKPASASR